MKRFKTQHLINKRIIKEQMKDNGNFSFAILVGSIAQILIMVLNLILLIISLILKN